MLGADHQKAIRAGKFFHIVYRTQASGHGLYQFFRRPRQIVDHALQAIAGENRYRVGARRQAPVDCQGRPGRAFLVLAKAITYLARVAQGSPVHALGLAAANVSHGQLHRPANGVIGSVTLAQGVAPSIHANLSGDRAVDDGHGTDKARRRQSAVQAIVLVQHRLDRGQNYGHVFGPAASHDCVDGYFLHGASIQVGGHQAQHFIRRPRGTVQHRQHSRLGRRDHRQAIAPAAFVTSFDGVFLGPNLDMAGDHGSIVVANFQLRQTVLLLVQGATARLKRRQISAKIADASKTFPGRAVPAIGAINLSTVFETHQGGHDFHIQPVRGIQQGIIGNVRDAFREGRIVLAINHQAALFHKLLQYRRDHDAGRAIPLDDNYQSVLLHFMHPVCA